MDENGYIDSVAEHTVLSDLTEIQERATLSEDEPSGAKGTEHSEETKQSDTLATPELLKQSDSTDNVSEQDLDEEQPPIALQTDIQTESYSVFGVSLLGRAHIQRHIPCQDYHLFADCGMGWHLYIVSDGAGSARESHRGSNYICELMMHSMQQLLAATSWQSGGCLPTEQEWHIEFINLCRIVKAKVEAKVEMLDEPVRPHDFNATLMLLVVTPFGMLCGHIGDGRMGYQDQTGIWHSSLIPHKGEEANMTIFLMNGWDKPQIPALRISDVFVPETRVIGEVPQKVVLMTDGCENFSWYCVGLDETSGIYRDRNCPFEGFLNPLFEYVLSAYKDNKLFTMADIINSCNDTCAAEQDDRTMMIGNYGLQRQNAENPVQGQNDSQS